MTADRKSKSNIANARKPGPQNGLTTLVVPPKLLRFCGEIAASLGGMFLFTLAVREARLDGDAFYLLLSRVGLLVAICFFVTQLLAVMRLVQFGGACVIDRKGFKHFSMGVLPWSAILGAHLHGVPRDETDGNVEFYLVLKLDAKTLELIRPNWIRRLVLRRYARFDVYSSNIELSCDFLKIKPDSLLWQVLQRTGSGSKRYVG